jgi:hypothetical protein
MADEQNTGAKAAKDEEPRYDVDYFRARSRSLLNANPHIVFGALTAHRRKTFTVAEAERAVKDLEKREIAPDAGAPE